MEISELVCLECDSWGEAYKNLELLKTSPDCQILEFGQIHNGRIVVIAETPEAPDGIPDNKIIEDPHPKLLEAYFKLNMPRVEGSLCILENESLCKLLMTANICIRKYNFEAVEIYRASNGYPRAWALLCNGNSNLELSDGEQHGCQLDLIPQTSQALQEFLN